MDLAGAKAERMAERKVSFEVGSLVVLRVSSWVDWLVRDLVASRGNKLVV